mgnify:CR=1 FL=1
MISIFPFSIAAINAVLYVYIRISFNCMILNPIEIYNFECHQKVLFLIELKNMFFKSHLNIMFLNHIKKKLFMIIIVLFISISEFANKLLTRKQKSYLHP